MKIGENIMEKNFALEKDDPYEFSLKFVDSVSDLGRIFEHKNDYMTDGPEQRSIVEFDIVEMMDEFSRIQISVSMESARKNLHVSVIGSFDVNINEMGFMSSLLSDYYLENVYPAVRKLSIERMKAMEKFIERRLV